MKTYRHICKPCISCCDDVGLHDRLLRPVDPGRAVLQAVHCTLVIESALVCSSRAQCQQSQPLSHALRYQAQLPQALLPAHTSKNSTWNMASTAGQTDAGPEGHKRVTTENGVQVATPFVRSSHFAIHTGRPERDDRKRPPSCSRYRHRVSAPELSRLQRDQARGGARRLALRRALPLHLGPRGIPPRCSRHGPRRRLQRTHMLCDERQQEVRQGIVERGRHGGALALRRAQRRRPHCIAEVLVGTLASGAVTVRKSLSMECVWTGRRWCPAGRNHGPRCTFCHTWLAHGLQNTGGSTADRLCLDTDRPTTDAS